jgi:hypothetical protein
LKLNTENLKLCPTVDLHYLANGTIAGTVIILKGSGLDESNIQP